VPLRTSSGTATSRCYAACPLTWLLGLMLPIGSTESCRSAMNDSAGYDEVHSEYDEHEWRREGIVHPVPVPLLEGGQRQRDPDDADVLMRRVAGATATHAQ
jgi:hypothetical protein